MTDRHSGYIVVLDEDIREDDAQSTINALKMVKGVKTVKPVVADLNVAIGMARTDIAWINKLIELIDEMRNR